MKSIKNKMTIPSKEYSTYSEIVVNFKESKTFATLIETPIHLRIYVEVIIPIINEIG